MNSWRPFIILLVIFLVMVLNAGLVIRETIPIADSGPAVSRAAEKLRHLQYLPNQRRSNLQEMGMDTEMADATAAFIERYKSHQPRLLKLLEDHGSDVGHVFCPSDKLPQAYAALEFLVIEENGKRRTIEIDKLLRFERQAWFGKAPVLTVYDTLERAENRPADATLMGVSAILTSREADLIDGRAPFARSFLGSWGFSRLESENRSIRATASWYFSLMHYITELANGDNGICS